MKLKNRYMKKMLLNLLVIMLSLFCITACGKIKKILKLLNILQIKLIKILIKLYQKINLKLIPTRKVFLRL